MMPKEVAANLFSLVNMLTRRKSFIEKKNCLR